MPAMPWRSSGQADPEREYLVLASRLPLRSHLAIPRFVDLTLSVVRQLEGTTGVIGYSMLAQPMRKTFWTLSAWAGQRDLDVFVRTMPHLGIMRKLRPHMGPTRFTKWTVRGASLPVAWDEAIERLMGSSAKAGPGAP